MSKLLTVLIPTYNNYKSFLKVINAYSNDKRVIIFVADDSSNEYQKECIKKKCFEKNIIYMEGKRTLPSDNWNYLMKKIRTPYFVLNHHDEYPNNLLFLDHLDSKNLGLLVLPCDSSRDEKHLHKVYSWQQRIFSIICLWFPNPSFNMILAPTAAIIVNSELKSIRFDNKLTWFIDADWYQRLFKLAFRKNLIIKFYSNSRIISFQSDNSITKKIQNKLFKQIKMEKIYFKYLNMLPNRFIRLLQLFFLSIILFYSKLQQFINRYF